MTTPQYETFELRIQPGPNDAYEALVTRSLAGDARTDFTLPFTDAELKAFLWQTVGATRGVRLVTQPGPAMDVRDFGTRLYRAAFGGAVGACLIRSLEKAKDRGAGLRIRLRVDDRLPALADLPWEYLYAPELGRFITPSDDTPLVRYLEVPHSAPPLPAPPPLTVLAVLSNPTGVAPLAVEREWTLLQSAVQGLQERKLLRLERLSAATLEVLQGRLRNQEAGGVHVLHFVGHGFFDDEKAQGGLVFENEQGRGRLVPASTIGMLLHDHDALRMVFLNACEGAESGRSDSFAGVAQQLVQQGVPAVLAMQFPIGDKAALALAQEFYRSLSDGLPADAALSEARKAIASQGEGYEWGTPVLFSRSEDNRLIELPQGDRRPIVETKPFEPLTVLIPGGPFSMGSDDPAAPSSERPQGMIDLPDFRIGKYPVTNRQYAAFIREHKDHAAPAGWFNREPQPVLLDHPVTAASWHDALTYCAWLSGETGRHYTLPSEAEWEKAASWDRRPQTADGGPQTVDGGAGSGRKRRYPWGGEWGEGRCNVGGSGTTAVMAYPQGASAYGVEDLLGNVQEWTRSLWGSQPAQPDFAYPYDPADGREVTAPDDLPAQARLVHRGGSFKSEPAEVRCTARGNALPDSKIPWRGFRVAMSIA